VPKTPEEQAFWDAVFLAAVPLWHNLAHKGAYTIAAYARSVANDALVERRKAQEPPNASP
jgi:hypothetical protein